MTPFILVFIFLTAWCRDHPRAADKAILQIHGAFLLAFYLIVPPILMAFCIAVCVLLYSLVRILIIGVAFKEISITLWAVCNFWMAVTFDRMTPDVVRAIIDDIFFKKSSAYHEWTVVLKQSWDKMCGNM